MRHTKDHALGTYVPHCRNRINLCTTQLFRAQKKDLYGRSGEVDFPAGQGPGLENHLPTKSNVKDGDDLMLHYVTLCYII